MFITLKHTIPSRLTSIRGDLTFQVSPSHIPNTTEYPLTFLNVDLMLDLYMHARIQLDYVQKQVNLKCSFASTASYLCALAQSTGRDSTSPAVTINVALRGSSRRRTTASGKRRRCHNTPGPEHNGLLRCMQVYCRMHFTFLYLCICCDCLQICKMF